jgi:predicted ATPase
MYIIHTEAKTFTEAYHEAQQRKATSEGAGLIHKVVKARYGDGYDIVAIEPALFAEMVTGRMPAIPQLREYSKLGGFGL